MSEKIVQLNEEVIKGQLKELVRGSVEETLNELLEQEAEKLTQAARYEWNEARQGYRSGHYSRNLAGVSVRRVEDITEALWGSKVSPATISELSKKAAREKAESVAEELRTMKLSEVAKKVETGVEETLTYCDFPSEHWTRIRTNNVMERLNREIRRRTVGQQEVHEYEALSGCPGGCLYCWLILFARACKLFCA